jgi:predicted DNA-binding transcriptional regulator AlpA
VGRRPAPVAEKPTAPITRTELSEQLREQAYSESEVLGILGICPETLERWHRRGTAPPKVVLPGRRIVYLKTSFNEWLKSREQSVRVPRARRHGGGARR